MSYADILAKWSAMGLPTPPGPVPEVKAKVPRTKAIAKPTVTTYKLDDTPRYNIKWHRGGSATPPPTPPPTTTSLYYYYIFF